MVKLLLLQLFFLTTICFCIFGYIKPENFYPYNSYSVEKEGNDWTNAQEKFVQLIQIVNSNTYNERYNLDDNIDTFEKILNDAGVGNFKILSTQLNTPFNLVGVLVQNVDTFSLKQFSQVSLIVDKLDPFVIKKVKIVVEPSFESSSFVKGLDQLQPDSQFRIKNPLNLFAPYDTSDNENEISDSDFILLQNVISEKYDQLKKF